MSKAAQGSMRKHVDERTAMFKNLLETWMARKTFELQVQLSSLGRGPHKNCKNDLDDQT